MARRAERDAARWERSRERGSADWSAGRAAGGSWAGADKGVPPVGLLCGYDDSAVRFPAGRRRSEGRRARARILVRRRDARQRISARVSPRGEVRPA
ncbi:hypothetical protein GCM10010521_29790 [Streptomyces rameus]|uniref:Uncharacterized protein n=1 Tax=Streptomyces rameus TaxID=68261 RepID=A0ABP6NA04_9ACTN